METDLKAIQFIGGVFLEYELPRERNYLLRYFRSRLERAFLRYYYCFGGDYVHFTEHTGYFCQIRWLKLLVKRHEALVSLHDKTKEEMDLSLLAMIESGKYKVKYFGLTG